MVTVDKIPVVDVHAENFQDVWPSLLLAMKNSTFVALDTELSGLGERRLLNAKCMEDRYKAVSEVARSRSILSLGLSFYKLSAIDVKTPDNGTSSASSVTRSSPGPVQWNFHIQTFNITLLCSEDYTVEPKSLQFLCDHGFDFNKQYSKGVTYHKGNDQAGDCQKPSIRGLFTHLLLSQIPVVFHNALVDLLFLYQNLYANLPFSLNSFVADLTEIFPGGVYDTKYITEFGMRMPASFLEYVFKKWFPTVLEHIQNYRENGRAGLRHRMRTSFPSYPEHCKHVTFRSYERPPPPVCLVVEELQRRVCEVFAAHGWCSRGRSCPKLHDVDLVLDLEELKPSKSSRRRRKRKLQENAENSTESLYRVPNGSTDVKVEREFTLQVDKTNHENVINGATWPVANDSKSSVNGISDSEDKSALKSNRSGGHRAGFDSFMTGYIMATFISKFGKPSAELQLSTLGLDQFTNKVYLTGKDIPLSIIKSNFTKVSKDHREKMEKLKLLH